MMSEIIKGLSKQFHDVLFAGAGTVIGVAQFGIGLLTKILKQLGDIERKIAIGVENKMGDDWEAINAYFYSGTSDVPLPKKVETGVQMLQ